MEPKQNKGIPMLMKLCIAGTIISAVLCVLFALLRSWGLCAACTCLTAVLALAGALLQHRAVSAHEALLRQRDFYKGRFEFYQRDRLLVELLSGDYIHERWVTDELAGYGEFFPKKNVVVGILSVDGYNRALLDQYCEDEGVDNQVYSLVRRLAEELSTDPDIHVLITARYEGLILIMNYTPEDLAEDPVSQEVKDRLSAVTEALLQEAESRYQLILSAHMGKEGEGVAGISKSFEAALRALEYRSIMGLDNRVIEYVKMDESAKAGLPGQKSKAAAELQRRFLAYMSTKNFDSAKAVMQEIIEDEFTPLPSIEMVRIKFYGILNMMYSAISDLRLAVDEESFRLIFPTEDLLEGQSYAQLQESINNVFDKLRACTEEKKDSAAPVWLEEVVAFLDENFTDCNLNINTLANHFSLSAAHMSRVFKSCMGMGILDYIQSKRVEEVKKQLDAGRSVKEASVIAGFSSSRTMSRSFVRLEGVTPGKFGKTKL